MSKANAVLSRSKKLEEAESNARFRLEADRKIRALKVANDDLKHTVKILSDDLQLRESQLDLRAAMQDAPTISAWPWKQKKTKGEATAIMLWSDWHVDEKVTPETTGGMNEWNPAIADRSIKTLVDNTLTLLEAERKLVALPRAMIWLGGDFISGPIHKELEVTNSMSPDGAIVWLKPRLKAAIQTILDEGKLDELLVVSSFGNHGRWTEKIQHKREWDVSREWWMCHELAENFNDDRVKWITGKSYRTIVDIEGYRVGLEHGHKNKYSEGVGGPLIPVNRKLGRLNMSRETQSDFNFMGHFHTAGQLGPVVMNASLIGNAEYGDGRFAFAHPSQTFMVMHRGYGITLRREVRVR